MTGLAKRAEQIAAQLVGTQPVPRSSPTTQTGGKRPWTFSSSGLTDSEAFWRSHS